jgi:hypothetical protein
LNTLEVVAVDLAKEVPEELEVAVELETAEVVLDQAVLLLVQIKDPVAVEVEILVALELLGGLV